jgi:hypothetical protein
MTVATDLQIGQNVAAIAAGPNRGVFAFGLDSVDVSRMSFDSCDLYESCVQLCEEQSFLMAGDVVKVDGELGLLVGRHGLHYLVAVGNQMELSGSVAFVGRDGLVETRDGFDSGSLLERWFGLRNGHFVRELGSDVVEKVEGIKGAWLLVSGAKRLPPPSLKCLCQGREFFGADGHRIERKEVKGEAYPIEEIQSFCADGLVEVTGRFGQFYYGKVFSGDPTFFRKREMQRLECSRGLWEGDRVRHGGEFGSIVFADEGLLLFLSDDCMIEGLGPVAVEATYVEVVATIAGRGNFEGIDISVKSGNQSQVPGDVFATSEGAVRLIAFRDGKALCVDRNGTVEDLSGDSRLEQRWLCAGEGKVWVRSRDGRVKVSVMMRDFGVLGFGPADEVLLNGERGIVAGLGAEYLWVVCEGERLLCVSSDVRKLQQKLRLLSRPAADVQWLFDALSQ